MERVIIIKPINSQHNGYTLMRILLFSVAAIGCIMAAVLIFYFTIQNPSATMETTSQMTTSFPLLFKPIQKIAANAEWACSLGLENPRRIAHIYEFFIFGFFTALISVIWPFQKKKNNISSGKMKKSLKWYVCCLLDLLICFGYSLLDQIHKLFVPGREFDRLDLILDAIGYVMAIFIVFAIRAIVIVISANNKRNQE